MGKRGPKPLPTAVKRLRGTDQPCRSNPSEPPVIPGAPDPPEFLDDVARAEWDRLVPELVRRGLLEVIDRAVLTTYTTAWSQLARAEYALRVEGGVLIDTHGRSFTSPYTQLAASARAQLLAAARELGLSPSARTTVRATTPSLPTAGLTARERILGPATRHSAR